MKVVNDFMIDDNTFLSVMIGVPPEQTKVGLYKFSLTSIINGMYNYSVEKIDTTPESIYDKVYEILEERRNETSKRTKNS